MTSIVDLDASSNYESHTACHICVVGAGAAGLYLAGRLSRQGLSVVVLDAGGATCGPGHSIGIDPAFCGSHYRGAVEGRAFGWGGSTSRWGGLLVPHSDRDIPHAGDPHWTTWKHIVQVVADRSDAVFAALGLSGRPDFFSFPAKVLGDKARLLRERSLTTVAAEFLPFTRRNLTYLASGPSRANVRVFLHAVVCKWFIRPGAAGDVSSIEATSTSTRRVRVSADLFVIAAGAIESARILLEIDRSTNERLLPRSAKVGQYLSDHLSTAIADVHHDDQCAAAETFGPVFAKGRMRPFRFIDTRQAPRSPRHFAHLVFDGANPGFRLAKQVLSAIQGKYIPRVTFSCARAGAAGLASLAYARLFKSRLYIPRQTSACMQLDVEQIPQAENRVRLGNDNDRYGRPVAVLQWQVSDADRTAIQSLATGLVASWPAQALGGIRLVSTNDRVGGGPKPYDAYHPVGTCRMGVDSEATVDLDLRVRGTGNLFLLSTAVFPSAGTANPTFSMLCLGDRLADQLALAAKRRPAVRAEAID
jgi:choline dehydrogenase-like flavoprotein